MKFSSASLSLLASMGLTSAFVVPTFRSGVLPLGMSNVNIDDKIRLKSESIPFLDVPHFMDGRMAGDVGFDPLGFADSEENLNRYREAEIKHARLAMLAAAGWPMSELFDKKIANVLNLDPVVDASGRVPSVLNGGMGKISPLYWVSCILLAGAVELIAMFSASKKEGYFPGNFGFDLFGLYPTDKKGQKWMQTAEIKNGRLAMLAITGFCFQEVVTHIAVVDQTPIFFKPIFEVLNSQVPGYIIPEGVVEEAAKAAASSADAVASATAEAITMTPPVDAISGATAEAIIITPPVDAISGATANSITVSPPIDTISRAASESTAIAPPVDIYRETMPAVTPSINDVSAVKQSTDAASTVSVEEYAAAKKRIVELESKLAAISSLSQ